MQRWSFVTVFYATHVTGNFGALPFPSLLTADQRERVQPQSSVSFGDMDPHEFLIVQTVRRHFRHKWFSTSGKRVLLFVCFVCLLVFAPTVRSQEFDLVHSGDLIDVDVVGDTEFDWRGRLSAEGFLSGLNSFGDPIIGICRTEAEIAADITKAYSKFLREPNIVVRVLDRSGRPVVILDGAVKASQKFQLNRPASLRELIVLAGGIRDDASGDIQILRPENLGCDAKRPAGEASKSNALPVMNITIKALISGNQAANPTIRSGDIITVRRADVIYVIGGVVNPRQVFLRESTTLSRAIAAAGGLTKQADGRAITLYRRENGETRLIEAAISKIVSGEMEDPPLKAFDIVEVAVKGAEKRKFPPVIADRSTGKDSIPLRIVD